ncbi:unnamed protein product [Taenia asiatica]|uniref:Uncharacterized protein n=1 Tax=Taenia asiatica TaxID=60517 RepID=A0A0R3VV47_TAEAS|nr:unnamed protein product [Taenia asiatica]
MMHISGDADTSSVIDVVRGISTNDAPFIRETGCSICCTCTFSLFLGGNLSLFQSLRAPRPCPRLSSPHLRNSSKARRIDSVIALANAAAAAAAAATTAASRGEVRAKA